MLAGFLIEQAKAQTDPMQPDVRPYAPQSGSSIDRVAITNGSLKFSTPLYSVPQRGKLTFSAWLDYMSAGFYRTTDCSEHDLDASKPCIESWQPNIGGGVGSGVNGASVNVRYSTDIKVVQAIALAADTEGGGNGTQTCVAASPDNPEVCDASFHPNGGAANQTTYFSQGYYWVLETPDNGNHKMSLVSPGIFRAIDGTGWMYKEASCVLIDGFGIQYSFACTDLDNSNADYNNESVYIPGRLLSETDSNGNTISLTYSSYVSGGVTYYQQTGWTDTVGRTIPIATASQGSANPCPQGTTLSSTWSPPGYTTPFSFCSSSVSIYYNLPVEGYQQKFYPVSRNVLAAVVLPDGNQWAFQYTPVPNDSLYGTAYNFGELAQVTMPTGGTLQYTWTRGDFTCGPEPGTREDSQIVTRTVNDETGPHTWSYTGFPNIGMFQQAPATFLVTENFPDGSTVSHTLTPFNTCSLYETETSVYGAGGGALLKTTDTAYQVLSTLDQMDTNLIHDAPLATAMPSSVTTTWPTGQVAVDKYTYDSGVSITGYDGTTQTVPLGLRTRLDHYDYGTSGAGALLRSDTVDYEALDASSYLSSNLLDAVSTETVNGGGASWTTVNAYDDPTLSPGGIAGNLTQTTKSGSLGGSVTTKRRIDASGDLIGTIDGNNYETVRAFSAPTSPFPTSIKRPATNGVTQQTSYTWDPNTGKMTSMTDENNLTTQYGYQDPLMRLTSINEAVGTPWQRNTVYDYSVHNRVATTADQILLNDAVMHSSASVDSLGRTAAVINSAGYEIDTTYDSVGRVATTTEPHTAGSSAGLTSYAYDGVSRKITQCNPDNGGTLPCVAGSSFKSWSYSGNTVTAIDEVGVTTTQTIDALGRLQGVQELGNQASPFSLTTNYSYNAADDITTVSQLGNGSEPARSRSFGYDSLGRLTASTNPETGTICYGYGQSGNCSPQYDGDNNLLAKTDARGVTTTYNYDAINRLVSKSYSTGSAGVDATPSACFSYDLDQSRGATQYSIGRLLNTWTQQGSCGTGATSIPSAALTWREIQSYNPQGLVLQEQQCAVAPCQTTTGTVTRSFDLAGNMTSSSNGAGSGDNFGDVVSYRYDAGNQLLQASSAMWNDGTHPQTLFLADPAFVSGPTYGPFGLLNAQIGVPSPGSPALLSRSRQYDLRGRVIDDKAQAANVTAGMSPTANPILLTMDANPDPAGVTAQAITSCDSTCGTGFGYWALDGQNVGGFSYSPGSTIWDFIPSNLPVGSTHQLQSFFQNSAGTWFSSAITNFTIVATSSVPTITMNASIANNPVPVGESGEIQIALSCTTNCGPARGDFTVNGQPAGGFDLDENGTAVVYTANNLPVGNYPVVVNWYGDGTHSAAQQTLTLNVANPPLPTGTTTATVAPFIGNSGGDVTDVFDNEYAMIMIKNQCQSACGGGQFFVDGNFAGGYVLDNTGSAVTYMYVPQGAAGTHTVTVNYAGNNSWAPYNNMQPISVNVIDSSTLPVFQIQAQPVSTPVSASAFSPLQITLTPNAASCAGSGQVLAQGNYVGGGTGQIFVDGSWSDWFYIQSDGTVAGNGRQYPLLRPTSQTGTHTLTVNFWGNNACGPTSQSFSYTNQ